MLLTYGTIDQWEPGIITKVEDSVLGGLILLRCDGSDNTLVECLDVQGSYGWRIGGSNFHNYDSVLLCLHDYESKPFLIKYSF